MARTYDMVKAEGVMLTLQQPSMALVGSYLELVAEMRDLGEKIWDGMLPKAAESHAGFVERLLRNAHTPEAGLVPASVYWGVREGAVVGRIALRHHLNANLEEFGGHIGYEVRPSWRRRGIAKEMLRQLLATPKAKEIGRLLVTCAPDNAASVGAIVANGGVLSRTVFVESLQRQTSYYWIDAATSSA